MRRATQGELRSASPLVRALREAYAKFGRVGPEDADRVARWVQRRVDELSRPTDRFDAKSAQVPAGDQ